ncbi:hypothetical protein ACT6QH_09930 [Xanthobacter sp. TB0139]|uniref:hypothetical protein n=1 Tax=Xanthobacter sp. TB0139 TaxID=3459178 RepID=UPI00403994DF
MALQLEMRVAHQIEGRTRLVTASTTSREALAFCAKRLATEQRLKIELRSRSGSLIVHYQQPWVEVARLCRAAGISLVPQPPVAATPIGQATTLLSSVNAGMSRATEGRMNLLNLTFVTLLIGALLQMRRGNWGGPATTLLFQALTLAMLQRGAHTHS